MGVFVAVVDFGLLVAEVCVVAQVNRVDGSLVALVLAVGWVTCVGFVTSGFGMHEVDALCSTLKTYKNRKI